MAIFFGSKGLTEFPTYLQAGSVECPFSVSINSEGDLTISQGTINGIIPNGLTGLSVSPTETKYLILNVTFAQGIITSATFALENSIPNPFSATEGGPPTSLKIFTHKIEERSSIRIIGCGSLWANPVELFRTEKAVQVAGSPLWVSWYGYEVIQS